MILTAHARKRARERFPELQGVALLEQYERARKPTPEQMTRILTRPGQRDGATYRVSPLGVVFVIVVEYVVTLFPIKEEKFRRRGSYAGRRRALAATRPRREREKWWERVEAE